jgi:ornithine decarboxylase
MTHRFLTAEAVVSALRPIEPLLLSRPHEARRAAAEALRVFPGDVAYAVKVCDRPDLLEALAEAGIRHFDVASIHEIRTVQAVVPEAVLHYMNPVKRLDHMAEAYGRGVRTFAFDCERELDKIAEATGDDRGILPVVRIAVPNDRAKLPLDGKFGCDGAEASRLLRLAATRGYRVGITFHVGSQCEDAEAYFVATEMACAAALDAGVVPAMVDIGGGFPTAFRGDEPSFVACVAAARRALDHRFPHYRGVFQCEPGRLLAAPAASVLVRVELRKGTTLHINDGYYGLLGELKWMPSVHPIRLVRPNAPSRIAAAAFALHGPTCDSIDTMDGPYPLPDDVCEGDWIEIELTGAYSSVLASRFNGFPETEVLVLGEMRAVRVAA